MKDRSSAERLRITLWAGLIVAGLLAVIFLGYEYIERTWLTGKSSELIHLLHIIRGVGSAVIVSFFSWWYIFRSSPSLFPAERTHEDSLSEAARRPHDEVLHSGRWFIKMRWIACIVAATLVILTIPVLHYLEKEAFRPLMFLIVFLAVSNVIYGLFFRQGWFPKVMLEIQIYADLVILTAMLHFSGGIENPIIFAYIFHIIIGGILLSRHKCYTIVLAATVLFGIMAFAEMTGIVHHRTLFIFPHPEMEHSFGEKEKKTKHVYEADAKHGVSHAAHRPLYVVSVVGLQFIFFTLTAHFTTTIIARLRVEENRAKAERQRLERVVEATGAGLVILNKDLRPVWLNDQIRKWLGLSRSLSSEDHSTGLAGWPYGEEQCVKETFQDKRVRVFERTLELTPGNERHFQITVAPIIGEEGNVQQVVELFQDITERKMLEAEMIHSGKMAVLGVMAAGIAHEVGNPLASISTRLRLLQENNDQAFVKESISVLQNQIRRIDHIVRGVSQFARTTSKEWTICEINGLVEETVGMLRLHRAAKKSEILTELDESLPVTRGVKDELIQVFLNLGINALEAMPDGGKVTIRTFKKENTIRIAFSDTGSGLDLQVSKKIIEPFFTTKEGGLGLGLYIAHHIVDAQGGQIEMENNPDGGALISVVLPIRVKGEPGQNSNSDYGDAMPS